MDDQLPDLAHFDHDDAWRLGCIVVERCRAGGHPVTISITIGEQRVFHVGLPGSSAMTDSWVDRKRNVVRHFDRSTLYVQEHYGISDWPGFAAAFATPMADFAPGEGAIPIRVRGTQVGVLALSGIVPTGDHELIEAALAEFAATADGGAA
jgi:uncharacterized protein (UPF0303 family)